MQAKRIFKCIFYSILTLALLFLIYFLSVSIYFNCKYVKTEVYGYSMQPTLNAGIASDTIAGDKVYVNKKASITNGDLIVAEVPWETRGTIIKRVIGMAGDTIQLRKDETTYTLLVNGKEITTKEQTSTSPHYVDGGGTDEYYSEYLAFLDNPAYANNVITVNGEKYIIVNENEYFIMGDNWGETTDSITQGIIKPSQIIGKVDLIISQSENETWILFKYLMALPFKKAL